MLQVSQRLLHQTLLPEPPLIQLDLHELQVLNEQDLRLGHLPQLIPDNFEIMTQIEDQFLAQHRLEVKNQRPELRLPVEFFQLNRRSFNHRLINLDKFVEVTDLKADKGVDIKGVVDFGPDINVQQLLSLLWKQLHYQWRYSLHPKGF